MITHCKITCKLTPKWVAAGFVGVFFCFVFCKLTCTFLLKQLEAKILGQSVINGKTCLPVFGEVILRINKIEHDLDF